MKKQSDAIPDDKAVVNLMVHALVDGELDAAAALAIERQIATDPKLAAEHRKIVALKAVVNNIPREKASDAFHDRMAAIGAADNLSVLPERFSKSSPSQIQSRRFNSMDWRAMAASVAITAVLASGATQWLMSSHTPESFAVAIADDHRRSLLAASPIDIASSDRHTVKPWLDAKLGVSPPAPDLTADGFALIGGRVEVIANKPVPALVYRHHEHLITLVAEPKQGGSVLEPVDLSAGGFSMVRWSDDAFSYWAISDTERPALDSFVARFRSAAGGR